MPIESGMELRGYPLKSRRVQVAGRVLEVVGPANYEALIDDPAVVGRFEADEYLPYWAEFWPASLLLAGAVAAWGPVAPGAAPPRVLEIGCGLGLASLVALGLGYSVIASDYERDALAFVAESARRNGLPRPELRYVDWRETYPDLRVDRLVAAEVLYEARNLRPVAEFTARHLNPDGFAVICDANRPTADAFAAVAEECGLDVQVEAAERQTEAGGMRLRGRIFRIRPRRS